MNSFIVKIKNFVKIFKPKRIIILILVVGIGYSIYSYYFSSNTKTTTIIKEYIVSTGSIENSIKITGKAALVDEQKLKFNQVGQVTKIYFKDGDKVKKGQLIAELDKEDVNNNIKQAELSLNDVQIKLQDLINGAEYKDILNGENNVKTAENKIPTLENDLSNLFNDYENKITDYDNQIIQKERDIVNNENDIKNTEVKLTNMKAEFSITEKEQAITLTDYNLTKTISDAYINAKKQIVDLENALYNADEILGISDLNREKNDSYENYIGAKNPSLKTKAENDWIETNTLFLIAKTAYSLLDLSNQSSKEINDFLDKLGKSYNKLTDLGKDGQEMMNASINSSTFSQSDINSKASVFSSITSTSQSNYSAIKTTIINVLNNDPDLIKAQSVNTINSQRQSIVDAELSLNKLKNDTKTNLQNALDALKSNKAYAIKNYEAQINQKKLDIESAKNSLEYAKESLRVLKSGATAVDLSQAKNNVAKQKLSLENARKNLDKYELIAPFDGVIRKIDFKAGDNIVADEQKYIYIENPNLVEISVTIDQLDIVKVSLGQKAKIVFDSYPDKEFMGSVSEKDSTPLETSGVTSYTITITLDKGNADIYSSMTAKVSIIVEGKNNILVIPASYIETVYNSNSNSETSFNISGTGANSEINYVIVKENGSEVKKEIALGITDDTNTEVTAGLILGDVIIKKITSTTSTTSSLIPSGGGGRTGGNSGGGAGGGRAPDMLH